jgi:hypothetical protein
MRVRTPLADAREDAKQCLSSCQFLPGGKERALLWASKYFLRIPGLAVEVSFLSLLRSHYSNWRSLALLLRAHIAFWGREQQQSRRNRVNFVPPLQASDLGKYTAAMDRSYLRQATLVQSDCGTNLAAVLRAAVAGSHVLLLFESFCTSCCERPSKRRRWPSGEAASSRANTIFHCGFCGLRSGESAFLGDARASSSDGQEKSLVCHHLICARQVGFAKKKSRVNALGHSSRARAGTREADGEKQA